MIVRDATDADMEAVLDMARSFCAHAGEDYHREHTLANIAAVRQGGFLLVAEDGGVIGMLAAIGAPGLCSPAIKLHEVCLWVVPDARGGPALLRLVREFDRRAAALGVATAQLSALANSPDGLCRVYDRLGYRPADSSFQKTFGGR